MPLSSLLAPRPLLLASASPRRRELLSRIGIEATVTIADVDELSHVPGGGPADVCLVNARLKAQAIAERAPAGSLVLAADTIVVIDGEVLGKPATQEEAAGMLRRLSGRTHEVMTGVVVLEAASESRLEQVVTTAVTFKMLSEQEVAGYVATGEPFDKAGGYGIQGVGAMLVRRVEGSYTNVVGLPLTEVLEALQALGGPRPFSSPPTSIR